MKWRVGSLVPAPPALICLPLLKCAPLVLIWEMTLKLLNFPLGGWGSSSEICVNGTRQLKFDLVVFPTLIVSKWQKKDFILRREFSSYTVFYYCTLCNFKTPSVVFLKGITYVKCCFYLNWVVLVGEKSIQAEKVCGLVKCHHVVEVSESNSFKCLFGPQLLTFWI